MNNVGSRTMAQAAGEEGDGQVRPAPQPGQGDLAASSNEGRAAGAAAPEDEAERLAAAQAERLRARAELEERSKANAAEALQSAAVAPAAPTPVLELHVIMMSDNTVQLRGPINDPEKFMALIAQAFFVLHNHTVTKVRAETEAAVRAQAKIPFMKRMLMRQGKAS